MSNSLNVLIKNVETLLHEKGMSKSDLARAMGQTPQAIGRVLSGVNNLGIDKVDALATAIGVSPSYLLMSPEERAKWDSTRPASGVSAQEKLQSVAMLLSDAQAASLLEMATRYLTQSPEDRVKALEAMTSGTVRTRKSR